MKLSRRQLRRLINEAINLHEGREQIDTSTPAVRCVGMPTRNNSKAKMIDSEYTVAVIDSLKAGSTYKKKPYYILCTGENSLMGTDFAFLGTHGETGDPYTYNHISGDRYQVISGPDPKPIGRNITIPEEKEIESWGSATFGAVKDLMNASKDALRKSSAAVKNVAGSSLDKED